MRKVIKWLNENNVKYELLFDRKDDTAIRIIKDDKVVTCGNDGDILYKNTDRISDKSRSSNMSILKSQSTMIYLIKELVGA